MTNIKYLIEKAQRNDLDAFGELVLIYQDRVYSHCHYLAGNSDDAQDLAQDVFVQAFRGIRSFRNEADFGTWLHRITVNQWINFCRRNQKVVTLSLDEPLSVQDGEVNRELASCEESPLDTVERIEFNEMVRNSLNRLLPEFQMVLILREIEGYNYDEIASMLECSLGTVKSRISRGRKALRAELEKQMKA